MRAYQVIHPETNKPVFCSTQAAVSATKKIIAEEVGAKPREIHSNEVDIPVKKDELLSYLNQLVGTLQK